MHAVTANPGLRIRVNDELAIEIGETASKTDIWGRGSSSTRRLAHLFARIALGTQVGRQAVSTGDGEQGPLLIDEIANHANGDRQQRTLEEFLKMTGDRQVVVFTADPATLDWALRRRGDDTRIHLLQLIGVTADPENMPDPQSA
jgi:hypothetical protein